MSKWIDTGDGIFKAWIEMGQLIVLEETPDNYSVLFKGANERIKMDLPSLKEAKEYILNQVEAVLKKSLEEIKSLRESE